MKKLILFLMLFLSSFSFLECKIDTLYKSKEFEVWLHDNYHFDQSKYIPSYLAIIKEDNSTTKIKWVFYNLPYDSLFFINEKYLYIASNKIYDGDRFTVKISGIVENATMVWDITSYNIYEILDLKYDIFKIYEKRYALYNLEEKYEHFTNIILSNTTLHQRIICLEFIELLKQYFLLK